MTGNPFINQPIPQDYNKSLIYIQWSCTLQLLKGGVLGSLRLLEVKNIATNKNVFPFEPKTAVYFAGSIHSKVFIFPSAILLQYRNDKAFSFSQLQNNSSPLSPSNPLMLLWLMSIETRGLIGQFSCSVFRFSRWPKPPFTYTYARASSVLLCLRIPLPVLWTHQVKVVIKDQPFLRLVHSWNSSNFSDSIPLFASENRESRVKRSFNLVTFLRKELIISGGGGGGDKTPKLIC